ncbi:hypothetical protein BU14_0493s0024 [Porphyra umbilicalis]|uniref:Small nuclear ribonucleoprotein Sm D1 n=1 Tax=Porphyra umbilicalis TaxID=2786 RepID=A0A1X6NTQ2_PORUM|nr:hypothetical protein BU14_0493s0024 [Porphyra umbilicalis]|eukprot:OSX71880.1 hypothetical protein BU14_0493s0024 [Porphyra umbilicalis]
MKLVTFLMKLRNEPVTVELKNGSCAAGTVSSVDHAMNIHLTGVRLTARGGSPIALGSLCVRGASVRYVLLPDSLSLDALLVDDGLRPPPSTPPTRSWSPPAAPSATPAARSSTRTGRPTRPPARPPLPPPAAARPWRQP